MMKTLIAALFFCSAIALQAQKLNPDRAYPAFAVGPTGIYATIEKGAVKVKSIAEGSPAAKTKMLKVGDVLTSVGGRSLAYLLYRDSIIAHHLSLAT